MKPSTYNEVFDRCVVNSKEIHLVINAPQHLCTINYNLYFAADSRTYQASFEQVVKLLQKSSNYVDVCLEHLPELPEEFKFREKLKYHESKEIQFKHFKEEGRILENHGQRETVQKQISAFGNTVGGKILLGVTNSGVVHGVDMQMNKQDEIIKRINIMIKNVKCSVILEQYVHWDIKFIPVSGDGTQERAVVAIEVAGMKSLGGVFMKQPESYELLGHDTIQVVQFDQWKQRMLSGSKLQKDTKGLHFL